MVWAGRYMILVAGAAFSVPLSFGGCSGPWLPAGAWVVVKMLAALLLSMRRLFPTVRPERLAEAVVVVMPVVLVQVAVAAVIVVVNGGPL